ncbi:MAG: hypothetical protein AAGF90_02925 [Pseudomonadota bacterium]
MSDLYRLAARVALAAVALGMVGLAALGLAMQRANDAAADDLGRGDLVWSAFQLELELERMVSRLNAFAAAPVDDADDGAASRAAAAAARQFDILWSRIAVFRGGEVGAELDAFDADRGAVDDLIAEMRAAEEAATSLADPAAAAPWCATSCPRAARRRPP